jgi:hypothetical protein
MSAHLPKAFDWVKAKARGFNWAAIFALLVKYGPQILQIIMDLLAGMTKAQLIEKYGPGAEHAIEDALHHAKPA